VTLLYVTADKVGIETGGGLVTRHEAQALQSLGPCEVWGRDQLGNDPTGAEPWRWDVEAFHQARHRWGLGAAREPGDPLPRLIHCYAGTFPQLIEAAKFNGVKVTYTAAAHDVAASRREHEKRGFAYDYPHLTDPALLDRYLAGYRAADVVICPSQHSARVMRDFGCRRVKVIPHGCELPAAVKPLPRRFTVGYLGSCASPDKGLVYLLEAWKRLAYKDAVLLLGGRDSVSPYVLEMVQKTPGAGAVVLAGWVPNVSDFYNACSLYVQPSCTEGFGLEVLEAMAHSRPVLCSDGAGAADVVIPACGGVFPAGSATLLADAIDGARRLARDLQEGVGRNARERAAEFTWDKIRARYAALWQGLLAEG